MGGVPHAHCHSGAAPIGASIALPKTGLAVLTFCMHPAPLILKHASLSRPSGQWSEDDYDVLADGVVVSRILKVHAAPAGSPWQWTYGFDPAHGRKPARGLPSSHILY
jgi:hypothetical protein